jgi:hypothetical protein
MEYDKKFIDTCEELFAKIKQNKPLKECLNTAATAATAATTDAVWFVYYMFFAIHNPKMEDYIQKKTSTSLADIIKNMLKRRNYTSTIVFRLYTHAYTNNGNVTHIYPKYKGCADGLIKSHQFNHLKTTAVHIRRAFAIPAAVPAAIPAFLAYIITTAPTTPASSNATAVINRINNHIHYKRKDIIILALACYMKIDEADINTKNIFIAATPEELSASTHTANANANSNATATASTVPEIPSTTTTTTTPYDEKYKYLYT